VRALEGFGETFYFPASMSLVSDYHGPATRSRALALHQSSVYIGTIAGSWLGAVIAEAYGWRFGFYAFGGGGLVLALLLYQFLREPRRGQAESAAPARADDVLPPFAALGAVLRRPTAWLLMAAFVAANFVATIFLTWTPTFLVQKFHFRLSAAGLSGAVYIHLASALTVPLGGLLADRLARRGAGGRALVQAGGLLAGSGFVFVVGTTTDVTTLLVTMALFGACKGTYDANIFAALYDVVEPRARATGAGLMNTVGWGGGALGPLFVGLVTRHGSAETPMENMSRAIAWCGAVYLVGAALLILAALTSRRPTAGSAP
jgi:MFS family permease